MVLEPLVVCGPSGVGKGTLINKFMEEMGGKERFDFTVSHTTRQPRPEEVDGIHYHFVSVDVMERFIMEDCFLEHAEVHGNYYGTSWTALKDVEKGGKKALLDIDVQGVKKFKSSHSPTLQPKYLFIAPPSYEILECRLKERGTESAESLRRRTENARAELEYGMQEGNFDFVVVNDELERACEEFAAVIDQLYQ
jgi:guanylate kinase